jgi:hypothetical protein
MSETRNTPTTEDVERQLAAARAAVLEARACWAEWATAEGVNDYPGRVRIARALAPAVQACEDALRTVRGDFMGIPQSPPRLPPYDVRRHELEI